VFFYLNYFITAPGFLIREKYLIYLLITLAGLAGFLFYIHLLFSLLFRFFADELPPRDRQENEEFANFFGYILPAIIYSVTILVSNTVYLISEKNRQKDLQHQIEVEKVTSELNFLKLQISPHFLFNTLNNIRWLVRKKSDDAEESVLKLSEVLRYITYDVKGKVPLTAEVIHLRNYIELQMLRIPVPGSIQFQVEEGLEQIKIEPLLFIHFVENAFKYGVDSQHAPDILFSISKVSNGLLFESRNRILVKDSNLESSGIGLANIQRRLELLYPGRHHLSMENTGEYFLVKLSLDLND
jgi:LytS/YehU family sensor histidine kinase